MYRAHGSARLVLVLVSRERKRANENCRDANTGKDEEFKRDRRETVLSVHRLDHRRLEPKTKITVARLGAPSISVWSPVFGVWRPAPATSRDMAIVFLVFPFFLFSLSARFLLTRRHSNILARH